MNTIVMYYFQVEEGKVRKRERERETVESSIKAHAYIVYRECVCEREKRKNWNEK